MELYEKSEDFTTSLRKALNEVDPRWEQWDGLIIAGTHMPTDVEEKIEKIRLARMAHRPFLGICFGFQLMIIEYIRTAHGKIMANSTEINPNTNFPIIIKTNELRVGMKPTPDLWGNSRLESFWHNYKINNEYLSYFVKDWKFTQTYDSDLGESIVDYMLYKPAIENDSFHGGVQYHPEYQNSKDSPHWILKSFLEVCKIKTKK